MNLFKYLIRNNVSRTFTVNLSKFETLVPAKDGSLALFSLSNDIFYNLALESYLAETINKQRIKNVLLLWISEPCIVLGRHQNPWLECNVKEASNRSVKVVRRYSGGGCVYHDYGNLNISFICERSKYDRQTNLKLIKSTLDRLDFEGIDFEITPRHDIFMKKLDTNDLFKLSGSAARLAQNFSYHHCTLLFDASMSNMKLLKSNLESIIKTKATPSVRSKCLNLKPFAKNSLMDLKFIGEKLCEDYWHKYADNWSIDYLFNYIKPEEDEELMAKLEPFHKELTSWQYIYGSTPKFDLHLELNEGDAAKNEVILTITNGIIKEYKMNLDSKTNPESLNSILNSLVDQKFHREELESILAKNIENFYSSKILDFFNKNL